MTDTLTGTCLCGAVTFEIDAPFRDVVVCHCTQCAKWTGHQVAATSVSNDRLRMVSGKAEITWYRSSDKAERGFCATCGSSLFWRLDTGDYTSIMAGILDDPTGLQVSAHIFTGDQRDYVATGIDAPRFSGGRADTPKKPRTGTSGNG